jgi:hypothetical protein
VPEAEQIERQLQQRRFVGLVGDVGVGKSMLLGNVQTLWGLGSVSYPAVVDLDGAWGIGRTAWLFFHAAAISIAGPSMSHLAALDEALMPSASRRAGFALHDRFGSEIAQRVLKDQTLPDEPEVLNESIRAFSELDGATLFIDHLEAPGRSRRHPVDVEQLLWQLRSVHQQNPSMRLCVCTRTDAAKLARGRQAPFYEDGIWLTVGPPDREIWEKVSADAWPDMDRATLRRRLGEVLAVTRGQPASTITTISQDVRLSSLEAEQRAAEEFALAAAAWIEHARSLHRLGVHVLVQIAKGEPPYASGGRTEITRALKALRNAGLVTNVARGEWQLTEPLIASALHNPAFRDALASFPDGPADVLG